MRLPNKVVKRLRRTASFRGLAPTTAAASRVGSANIRSLTSPERLLGMALRRLGLRYRANDDSLPGKPDIVFKKHKVAVFCDGDFWHARYWAKRRVHLARGSNSRYWVAKILGNRRRDRAVSRALMQLGWSVVRVWEGDVRNDAASIALRISRHLKKTRASSARLP